MLGPNVPCARDSSASPSLALNAENRGAAALRAAADQRWEVPPWYRGDDYLIFRDAVTTERNRLLALATELDPTP